MSGKVFAGLGGVARDGVAQGGEIVELRLVAELAQEANVQPPAVELVALPIENMHFEERLGHRIYRRPAADARDATAELIDLDDVNASERRLLRERDIRRRKTELAPEARARHHLAADRVGASEQ